MSTQVYEYRHHAGARPQYVVVGTLRSVHGYMGEPKQLAICHDEDVARVVAGVLDRIAVGRYDELIEDLFGSNPF